MGVFEYGYLIMPPMSTSTGPFRNQDNQLTGRVTEPSTILGTFSCSDLAADTPDGRFLVAIGYQTRILSAFEKYTIFFVVHLSTVNYGR